MRRSARHGWHDDLERCTHATLVIRGTTSFALPRQDDPREARLRSGSFRNASRSLGCIRKSVHPPVARWLLKRSDVPERFPDVTGLLESAAAVAPGIDLFYEPRLERFEMRMSIKDARHGAFGRTERAQFALPIEPAVDVYTDLVI